MFLLLLFQGEVDAGTSQQKFFNATDLEDRKEQTDIESTNVDMEPAENNSPECKSNMNENRYIARIIVNIQTRIQKKGRYG